MNASLRRQVRWLESRAERAGVQSCGTCGNRAGTGSTQEGGGINLVVPMPAIMGEAASATGDVPIAASSTGCAECEPVLVLTVPPPRRICDV